MTYGTFNHQRGVKRLFISASKVGGLLAFMVSLSIIPWCASASYGKEPLSVSGVTEPIKDLTLSATVAGTISTIFMKEGMTVKKGTVILELDKTMEALEVERRRLVWESKAEVEAAAVRATVLKSLSESTRELYNSTGSVSREELEKMQLEYELALAEKKRLEAVEERERIEYEISREALQKRLVVSPAPGTVVKLFFHEGEGIQENQPLVHVVDTSRGILVCNAEEWIGRTLKKGQTVDLKINAGTETVARKGTIVFVSPVVDQASGLLEVKAEFDNQDGALRPGVAGILLIRDR